MDLKLRFSTFLQSVHRDKFTFIFKGINTHCWLDLGVDIWSLFKCYLTHSKHTVFKFAGTFRLMQCKEINAVYSENKSTQTGVKNYKYPTQLKTSSSSKENVRSALQEWNNIVSYYLTYHHHQSGSCTLGKPKQRWKDQKYLQV